ncbi:MAG: dipeptidase [Bacteroidota bacterium]
MSRLSILLVLLALPAATFAQMDEMLLSEDPLRQRADSLAQALLILDGHIDVPYRLMNRFEDVTNATETGDFDYPRAKAGGLNAPFMSIYVPASYQETGGAKAYADSLIDLVTSIADSAPEKFAIATSTADVLTHFAEGKISLPMGMENGAPIEDDLANVKYFRDRGIRYITLSHSRDNLISDSSYDTTGTWGGLSPFGKDVVREMNRVGIIVDISHISDHAFFDVMDLTDVPVIASHSSARHFTPEFERNMSDDMIRRLGEEGGVIMINFGSTFIDGDIRKKSTYARRAIMQYMEQNPNLTDSLRQAYIDEWRAKFPQVYADVTDVVDHIDHVVSIAGVDHVGFGSDYDGVGDTLPTGLKDVAAFPNLIYHLLQRGYTDEDIAKMAGGNALRVWKAVEEAAEI